MDNQFFTLRVPKEGKPEKTFFFRRPDGSVFACNAKQASSTSRMEFRDQDKQLTGKLEYIGTSDGKTFLKKFREAIDGQNEALEELGDMPSGKVSKAKWTKKRLLIEKASKEAFAKAQDAEFKTAKREQIPDLRSEVLGVSAGVNISNINSLIRH